jgi:hypothetical protein
VINEVLKSYPNKVNFVIKSFPLSFHPHARPAAKLALAANEQGKYFEMVELLLQNKAEINANKIKEYAQNLISGMPLTNIPTKGGLRGQALNAAKLIDPEYFKKNIGGQADIASVKNAEKMFTTGINPYSSESDSGQIYTNKLVRLATGSNTISATLQIGAISNTASTQITISDDDLSIDIIK